MYLDTILLISGAAFIVIAAVLAVYLLLKRGSSHRMRELTETKTELIDVVSILQEKAGDGGAGAAPPQQMIGDDSKTLALDSSYGNALIANGLDVTPLEGKYELIRELGGGGMSRVFLGRKVGVDNEWIVKYVDNRYGALANEAAVLKKLNNISLPQIIDIFDAGPGTYLVERFVEGYPLDKVMELRDRMSEGLIADWGLQIAQVLRYLHQLDTPIIHCDMKPSNIMVTYDNRLVLIDFGISKVMGVDGNVRGLTVRYAAPEQFMPNHGRHEAAVRRFGTLPADSVNWRIDIRTDIYSTGVILFELLTGTTPVSDNMDLVYSCASRELADVVRRCIQIDPAARFQTDDEFVAALEDVIASHSGMQKRLMLRRIAGICAAAALAIGTAATASGAYVNRLESTAVISMSPSRVVVSLQQGVTLRIKKDGGFGEGYLTPGELEWTDSGGNIARVDDDRLVGVNVGETTLWGTYRNKTVEINVTVTEPVNDLTEISLRYPEGWRSDKLAGNGERDYIDGDLSSASFVSPESVTAVEGGFVVTDSGALRIVRDGQVSTVFLDPFYLTAEKVRLWEGELYVLTGPWQGETEMSYGIAKVAADGTAELIYETSAVWTVTTDMAFSPDGNLWFIQRNLGLDATVLGRMGPNGEDPETVAELPAGASCLTFDSDGNAYISVPESGLILTVPAGTDTWSYLAGVDGERNFIDGSVANFYRPTSLVWDAGYLYVLDFDTLRRVTLEDGAAVMTETLAGVPEADTNPDPVLGDGAETLLPASELAELTLDEDGRFMVTDPKNSAIYVIYFLPPEGK